MASRFADVSRGVSSATSAASASRASATSAAATGKCRPTLSASTSIWRNLWRSASSSSGFSKQVSVGARREPTTSTVSAVDTTSLATAWPQFPNTPSACGCTSAIALLPVAVVATGIARRSASAVSSDHAREACTPLPARMTGLDDARSISATRATSAAAGRRTFGARTRSVAWTRGGRFVFTVPCSDRLPKTTATGPGVPVVACLMASWIVCIACFGSYTAAVYLVALARRFLRSWLPCSPVPAW